MSKNVEKIAGASPFFSIGVVTYNRPDLLKQCLRSILGQTFSDFEVIVGNDYTKETLSAELFGINDSRIRFINNPTNLGEVNNMNSLLPVSRGRYFTWQFDDDFYAPDFLESVYGALTRFNQPKCAYTSYGYVCGTSFPKITQQSSRAGELFSGRQFLRMYLSGRAKVVGGGGVFETEYLREIGGMKKLCGHPIGAHSEHFILVQTGLLDKVAYINQPLVLYRNHGDSWSYRNDDAETYKQAGRNFIRESVNVLTEPVLRDDFEQNFSDILNLSANIVLGKLIARDGYFNRRELEEYLASIEEQLGIIKDPALHREALTILARARKKSRYSNIVKGKFKAATPAALVKLAFKARALISR